MLANSLSQGWKPVAFVARLVLVRGGWIGLAGVLSACVINPRFDPTLGMDEGTSGESEGATSSPATTTTTTDSSGATGDDPQPLGDPCPPLPPPEGEVISVGPDQATELPDIVQSAAAGSTIVLEPGTYAVTRLFYMVTPSVTVRSSTGNPEDVIIDGGDLDSTLFFVQGTDVTLAELTLRHAPQHLVHVSGGGDGDVTGVLGYRLHLIDPGLAAFKINTANDNFADAGTLACSTITLTDEGRPGLGESCGPAGVLGVGVADWHIRDNRIEGFWCPSGDTFAMSFIEGCADILIERNTIVDAAMGIRLGVHEFPPEGSRVHGDRPGCGDAMFDHYGGVVRNNMITATGSEIAASEGGFYAGIALWKVCGSVVVHNTVMSAVGAAASIEYRFERSQQEVLNNLVTHPFRDRDGAAAPMAGNMVLEDLAAFVDPLAGDAHLRPDTAPIDAGVMLGEDAVTHDIDGDPRIGPPDVGADEL